MEYLNKIKYSLLLLPLLLLNVQNSQTISKDECKDVAFVFARGSGESLNDKNYQEFKNKIEENISGKSIKYSFYELGSSPQNGHQYPATAIGFNSLSEVINSIGAYVSAGESYAFGDSVKTGTEELTSYINATSSNCKSTKYVISGYSQGGLVVSNAIKTIDSSKIIYAATLGDPKLYLPEGSGSNPDACRGKNLSNYRAYVPDCKAYEGILGKNDPYQPNNYIDKLGAWCNYHDIICSKYISILQPLKSHVSYVSDGIYDKLAKVINNKLSDHFPDKIPKVEVNLSTHDVAILIDSTGSMSGLIEKYKSEALRLAKEAIDMDGRIALYEYRDLSDPFDPIRHCGFETCTLDTFKEELDSITVSGGGDELESAMSASLKVLDTEKWKLGAVKTVVLLTDAGYHPIDIDKVSFHQVVRRSLEIDPVNFYIITTPETAEEYHSLAESTGGKVYDVTGELSLSTDSIIERPTAILSNPEYSALVGEELLFDASSSIASSNITKYEWDLDCDGVFETTTVNPTINKVYFEPVSGYIQVRITDKNGLIGTMSAKLDVLSKIDEVETETKIINYAENENSITIDFSKSEEENVYLILNDAFLGKLTENHFTITDLNKNIDNTISLIPFSNTGERGEPQTILIKNKTKYNKKLPVKAPDSGIMKKTTSNSNANDHHTRIYKRQDF